MNKPLAISPVTAIDRGLTILEVVSQSKKGLTNSEVSRKMKLPKSTTSYILRTLKQRGYLHKDDNSGKYRLTAKLFSVGSQALRGLDLHDIVLPILQELVDKTGLTGHLAILDGYDVVYIEKIDKPGFIMMNTWVGLRLDVHCTAVGKVLIAYLPQANIEEIIRERGLAKHTPQTITSPSQLFSELARVRAAGYALDKSENSFDVKCIAAPIFDTEGKVKAAVGLTGTESQMRLHKLKDYVRLIKQAAKSISRQLGYDSTGHRSGLSERILDRTTAG
ncbi:MAG: IclR family transcriptional regulator [Candidatus Binatia bacterium]